jgi:beta-glucanase (GH16 family)
MPLRLKTNHSLTLSLAASLLLLAGCGGGGGSSDDTATDAAQDGPMESALSITTSSSLVPMMPTATYTVSTDELLLNNRFDQGLQHWNAASGAAAIVASDLRSGGYALKASGEVIQPFGAALLQPGKSYTLKVKARNLGAGSTTMAVRFREKTDGASYRTFKCALGTTAYQECRVDFTVPAYAAMAELALMPQGTTTIIDSASLMMRSAMAQTEAVTTLVGSYVPAGYALVFNDEFNGSALNRNKWFTRYIYKNESLDRLNDEQQRYTDNNHQVTNGLLSIVARKVSSTDPAGIDYESGMLRSDFTFRYGYVEARVRMPGGKGVWPAFWLNSDVSEAGVLGWPPEIDIFEVVNNGQDDTMNMLHTGVIMPSGAGPAPFVYADAAFNKTWTYWRAPFNFSDGWHTVAAQWTPEGVSTFVDGKKIVTRSYAWTLADGTPAGKAHILLNLAVGGNWAGRYGIDDSAFPQALQINWVRAYQKAM